MPAYPRLAMSIHASSCLPFRFLSRLVRPFRAMPAVPCRCASCPVEARLACRVESCQVAPSRATSSRVSRAITGHAYPCAVMPADSGRVNPCQVMSCHASHSFSRPEKPSHTRSRHSPPASSCQVRPCVVQTRRACLVCPCHASPFPFQPFHTLPRRVQSIQATRCLPSHVTSVQAISREVQPAVFTGQAGLQKGPCPFLRRRVRPGVLRLRLLVGPREPSGSQCRSR